MTLECNNVLQKTKRKYFPERIMEDRGVDWKFENIVNGIRHKKKWTNKFIKRNKRVNGKHKRHSLNWNTTVTGTDLTSGVT